jgi:hypothetical protein
VTEYDEDRIRGLILKAQYDQIISLRDDLIFAGVDPDELEVPIEPIVPLAPTTDEGRQ